MAGTASHSQPSQRAELSGHVAPRCWATAVTAADLIAGQPSAAARCNQGWMPLSIQVAPMRDFLPRDGMKSAAANSRAGAAIEVHVAPIV